LTFCRSRKAGENLGGFAGFVFSSKGRSILAGVLIGKGGPEGFLGATTFVGVDFFLFEDERATTFVFFELFLEPFLDLDFFAMKFQTYLSPKGLPIAKGG
jgi:hypothetical protein